MRGELERALAELGPGEPCAVPAPGALWRYRLGEVEVLAGWSGIGRGPSERLLRALTGDLRPEVVLHLGVAGGLEAGSQAGDAVLCERASSGDDTLAWASHEGLSGALGPLPRGGCVTVGAIVSKPSQKRALAAAYGAQVVEMETYWVARLAEELGLSLACVRVVCDALEDELPDLSMALDPVGQPKPLAMARRLLTRPGTAARLPALASAFGRAQRRLEQVAGAAFAWARSA
jgi:nucleoside phosphorylase